MLPRYVELVPEWTGLPGEQRSEQFNGLDTALSKTYLYLLYMNLICEELIIAISNL